MNEKLIATLQEEGFTWNQVRRILNLMAEESLKSNRVGYNQGFNQGWEACKKKVRALCLSET